MGCIGLGKRDAVEHEFQFFLSEFTGLGFAWANKQAITRKRERENTKIGWFENT